MKSVLVSINPKYCEKIFHEIGWCIPSAKGKKIYEKRLEVRKSKPNEVPFKAYIYCTGGKLLFKSTDGNLYISKYFNYKGQEDAFNCKVIGEFVCDRVYHFLMRYTDGGSAERRKQYYLIGENSKIIDEFWKGCCISPENLSQYIKPGEFVYGWHISDLKIYDKPKELGEFSYPCPDKNYDTCYGCKYFYHDETEMCCEKGAVRPPRSWCYVEELK